MESTSSSPKVADVVVDRSADDILLATRLQALDTTFDGSGSHDAVSPLNSLPAEIFLDILVQSIDFGDFYRTSLSQFHVLAQVCLYWWHSIRSDPRFWRDISVNEEDMVQTVLKKNPNGPLSVQCRQTWSSTSDCTRFLQIAKQHASRWQSATFRFEKGCKMEYLHGVYAPLLKTLLIENEVWTNDDDAFLPISLPRIEHLDLSHTFMTWGELSGLKYLRLANIPETQLDFNQLLALVSSSPGLEWLGIEYVTIDIEDPELYESEATSLTLPALRGFEHMTELNYDEAAQYLNRNIDAPQCYRLVTHLHFGEVIRSGSNLKKLIKLPMEAANLRIVLNYLKDEISMSIDSAEEPGGRTASWALDSRSTPDLSLYITDVPFEQAAWSLLIDTLGIPVKKLGVTLKLRCGDQVGFSVDDIAFWNMTTRIEFAAGYPHIIPILRHLSEPNVKDGVSVWPCPWLESILLEYGLGPYRGDWNAPADTLVAIQDAIRDFRRRRSMDLDTRNGANPDGEQNGPLEVTITAKPAYIEKLRGHVAEGVQLVAW